MPSTQIASGTRAVFGRRLRAWYRRQHRDLPWRKTRDPYHVLVSELMLQQTQVSRVVEFYDRFIRRFPTMRHLADARPRRVM
jgi:A/G-specific adenine glycosylase